MGKPTCTQQESQWLIPAFQNKIPYLQVKDIDFSSPNSKIDNSIATGSLSASSSISPLPLHSLYESKYLALTYSELLLIYDSVTIDITNDMTKAVREETVKQTESKL